MEQIWKRLPVASRFQKRDFTVLAWRRLPMRIAEVIGNNKDDVRQAICVCVLCERKQDEKERERSTS
jgi:hypothetical protein